MKKNLQPQSDSRQAPTFAMVPAGLIRSGGALSDGALMLLCWLIGAKFSRTVPPEGDDAWARPDALADDEFRPFQFTNAEAAKALGVTPRCIRTWRRELRGERGALQGEPGAYTLHLDGLTDDVTAGTWTWWMRLSMAPARELPPHLWRVWAILATYSNRAGIAYPNRMTLAADAGKGKPTIRDALRQLAERGYITRRRRRRGSALTIMRHWEGRNETVPGEERDRPWERNEIALQGRNETVPEYDVSQYENLVLCPVNR